MDDKKIKLQIVTPDRLFYKEEVNRVVFRTTEGDLCVLRDHIPMTVSLGSGLVVIINDKTRVEAVLHGGFVEIQEESVMILTDAAEWPSEIDVDRAKEAKKRAQDLLEQEHQQDISQKMVKASLMRAVARIELSNHMSIKKE